MSPKPSDRCWRGNSNARGIGQDESWGKNDCPIGVDGSNRGYESEKPTCGVLRSEAEKQRGLVGEGRLIIGQPRFQPPAVEDEWVVVGERMPETRTVFPESFAGRNRDSSLASLIRNDRNGNVPRFFVGVSMK
jgi:hypothetical protein